MENIILKIKQAIETKGISETTAANMAGLKQVKVNRMLSGKTKKIDMDAVRKLQAALGITDQPLTIAEQIGEGYGPEVKVLADYLEVKVKGKTPEERLKFVEDIMADIRAKYK